MELEAMTRSLLGGRGEYRQSWVRLRLQNAADRAGLSLEDFLTQTSQDDLRRILIHGTGELFRDPFFFAALRREILPSLPARFAVWMPLIGALGDFYSVLITLAEERPADTWIVYGSDWNPESLKTGRVALDSELMYRQNYLKSGGKRDLSEYVSSDLQFAPGLLSCAHTGELPADTSGVDAVVCRDSLLLKRSSARDVIDQSVRALRAGGWFLSGVRDFPQPPHPALSASPVRRGIYRKTV